MNVVLNGRPRELPPGTTLGQVVKDLHLVPQRVAVELNQGIVRRIEYDNTELHPEDRLEIVTFEGGG